MRGRILRSGVKSAIAAKGFTLIEVLVSLVVLAVGLLGLAMLQTTNLRLAQSANERTIATNLAYELMDDIRMNRLVAAQYSGSVKGSDAPTGACNQASQTSTPATQRNEFGCKMAKALGSTSLATIEVTGDPDKGEPQKVTVIMSWDDEGRWKLNADPSKLTVESKL